MENDNTLIVEKKGYVATLTFNRPEKRNALAPSMLIQLYLTLKDFSRGDDVRCVILRGHGDVSFSAGYDIGAIPTKVDPEIREALKNQNPLELALNSVKSFQYPTIAMLNGYAFGAGFNMSVCCDVRIAADNIRMSMPPAKLGLVYHIEGIKQFIQTLGPARAMEIFMTGRAYQGRELLEKGLVDYLVPRQELEAFTLNYAETITGNAPLSLKAHKRIINMFNENIALNQSQTKEAESLISRAFQSDDLREGQVAFIQKRQPVFTGK